MLEFTNPEEIHFPKNCIACSKPSYELIRKYLFGRFIPNRDYKIDYTFDFPVCSSCKKNIEMKTGLGSKSGKILFTSIISSIIIAIIIYYLFKAYLFSISILIIAIVVPSINHRKKMKSKLKAEDFFQVGFDPQDQEKIQIILKNIEYAKLVEDVNKPKIINNDELKTKVPTDSDKTTTLEPLNKENTKTDVEILPQTEKQSKDGGSIELEPNPPKDYEIDNDQSVNENNEDDSLNSNSTDNS